MLIKAVESYIEIRRAAGYGMRRVEPILRSFADFAAQHRQMHVVANTAIEWASRAWSPLQRDLRLETVIRFARHIRAEDSRHEIPPHGVFGHQSQRRPVPFIFSPEETHKLVEEAIHLGPPNSLRPYTYSTLFSLLTATGLRISEAFGLRLHDITADGFLIRETKFHKSRLIPLHETAEAGLARYLVRRRLLTHAEDYLFVSLRGHKLCYEAVWETFNSLVRAAGIQNGSRHAKPHIHSFRHTFAVRALEACPNGSKRIAEHILGVSTYMGHSSLASTYWYLEATPSLMNDIAEAWQLILEGGAR